MNNKAHTPLFHVSRRAALPWYGAWGIRAAALLIALLACALITNLITGLNPLEVYATIWQGSFGSARRTWVLFQNIAMLLCVSLAITPAFRMRCWNLGGDGQMLIGCLATTACMILLGGKLPNGVVILCMFVSSVLAGAVWAAIPAFFKAKWNTNETLFTLMMNYIATQLVAYYIIIWEVPKGAGGRRQDWHHQPEHPGRLAPPDRQLQVSAEHPHRRRRLRSHVRLPQLLQARL